MIEVRKDASTETVTLHQHGDFDIVSAWTGGKALSLWVQ